MGRFITGLYLLLFFGRNSRNSNTQCAIPAFEGLFPGTHDTFIRKLLFELATWHGLAKLRLHTETNVCDLESSTARLGELLRRFESDVCPAYQTFDLPVEEAARVRRRAAAVKKMGVATDQGKGKQKATSLGSKKPRTFNLSTYKIHALGAYAKAIRLYGSPDNYNSQTVRSLNSFYLTTLTPSNCRVNLSTDEGSAFSKVYAKEDTPLSVLVFKYDGSVSYTD